MTMKLVHSDRTQFCDTTDDTSYYLRPGSCVLAMQHLFPCVRDVRKAREYNVDIYF